MIVRILMMAGALSCAAGLALAQTPMRIRGTLASISGDALHVTAKDGADIALSLDPNASVTAVVPARIADATPGSFIGTAAKPGPDGTLTAFEVHIFPEAMRGTGEGHYAFDLGPQSTMTNGTIGQEVTGNDGQTLKVQYKGGEKTILVPKDVPVVTFMPGDRAMLAPGAHVIVFAQKTADGALKAGRVAVGKDGLTPPM